VCINKSQLLGYCDVLEVGILGVIVRLLIIGA
jgi:hypothetical protein